ncbi:hypothetical protein NIES4071_58610 [Calothrix sp. NIES-4071]|nr:hypothetical protein NIES4071_58610 [Calothrix sp. NIES-4071]BAZ60168.1 hypothetical protein NIES4105_58560 [Calothrix sp. NIES-4105]
MFVREKIFNGNSITPFQLTLNQINQMLQGHVKSGPFVNMKYVSESIESAHYPKLLGTYELELHPVIEELCNTNFDTIVNVGAGEGYYSAGFALRNNHAQILAFEPRSKGRQLIKEMAQLNGVSERVTIHGLCDAPALEESLYNQGKCLVFMDCEGGEAILLDPRICPSLKTATIVVELHPFLVSGVGEIIESRFQNTHSITQVWTRPRTEMDFPIQISQLRRTVLKKHLLNIMFENRQELMRFFYLKPNQ